MPTIVPPTTAGAGRAPGERADELFPLLYDELRRLAAAQLARLHVGGTLQPTALVHEAFLKLSGRAELGWEERRHFFATAAQAMRELAIDHARRKRAGKRGGGEPALSLDETPVELATDGLRTDDILAIDRALEALEREHPRTARVALLRCFGGLSTQEIADVLGVTTRTIEREWRFARAYLHAQLEAYGS